MIHDTYYVASFTPEEIIPASRHDSILSCQIVRLPDCHAGGDIERCHDAPFCLHFGVFNQNVWYFGVVPCIHHIKGDKFIKLLFIRTVLTSLAV